MAFRLKQAVVKCVSESVPNGNNFAWPEWIGAHLKLLRLLPNNKIQCHLMLPREENGINIKDNVQYEKMIKEYGYYNKIIFTNYNSNGTLKFEVNVKDFIEDVLSSNPTDLSFIPNRKKVIVEFSSPNIAKEFHVGHLRSTIIGNVLSNLMKKMGKDVVKLNYLGDWGTQFGLIKVGMDHLGYNKDMLNKDSVIMKLQNAYVHANKMAENDSAILDNARDVFQKLENGDEHLVEMWRQLQEWSKTDLISMYERLGIKFDEYNWESSYNKKKADKFLNDLESKGIVKVNEDGCKVVEIDGKEIILLKSSGTTLYLLRDLMAVFDRRKRHNFDELYYVVENGQTEHFSDLFEICEKIELGSSKTMHHVKFGRILGMSTRRGTNVSLRSILDEAQERMYKKQIATETTKGIPNMETADILGTTAVLINDLKRRRMKDYRFDWETALNSDGDSGVQLQYAHCRLFSLLENSGADVAGECDARMLMEPEAIQVALNIARFEEILAKVEKELEPFILVQYLFELVKSVNRAFRILTVKNSEPHLANQRLLLFNTARLTISEGLGLLGIRCLKRM